MIGETQGISKMFDSFFLQGYVMIVSSPILAIN